MKLSDLKRAVLMIEDGHDDKEVKVWLPGSTISLGENFMLNLGVPIEHKSGAILIEGNIDQGSAILKRSDQ